ncbi:MAG: replication-associated recombination protein A [Hydrotalea sp.]|nr:replication-associated recombination protein A [Hydrotalea sp.]
MSNLFDQVENKSLGKIKTGGKLLADALRPDTLVDVVGQEHLTADNDSVPGPLLRMVREKKLRSMILWGPPGVGKTTLALLLARDSGMQFRSLSAIFSGVADLKRIFEEAETAQKMGLATCLFVDEIHRFNRAQQDSFLPFVERGVIILIGATTENPSFALNNALLSRLAVFVLKPLTEKDFAKIFARAEQYYGKKIMLDDAGKKILYDLAAGDGRYFLNMVEQVAFANPAQPLAHQELLALVQKKSALYDKGEDGHYNYISALHKSVRGSDPDAALYWLYRMLNAGEDRDFLARRIVRMAYEDVGLADVASQTVAITAWQTMERLGSPEGEIALAEAVVYLALAPKSNSIYKAIQRAEDFAKQHNNQDPPKIILNSPTKLMKNLDYGKDYVYDHNDPDGFSGQHYFPDGMARVDFFQPVNRGFERELIKRKDYFSALRAKKQKK